MKLGELKKFLAENYLPDDTEVVVPGGDHSYGRAYVNLRIAEFYKKDIFEYYDENNRTSKDSTIKPVILIS